MALWVLAFETVAQAQSGAFAAGRVRNAPSRPASVNGVWFLTAFLRDPFGSEKCCSDGGFRSDGEAIAEGG